MKQPVILYAAIFRSQTLTPLPVALMCTEVTAGPPRTVLYNRIQERWEFNRSAGAHYLFDMEQQERTQEVSRAEAERIAREVLGTQVPTEMELHQMILAGEAAQES